MAYLDLIGIHKRFGKTVAVSDLSLSVEQGEFISFLGPSGCGKTTTLRMIAGLEQPDAGRIILDGHDLTEVPPNRRGAGMVFQSYALFPNLSVQGNIAFGLEVARRPKSEVKAGVSEMLQLVGLDGIEERYPHQLSGGQQQRVALARALALRPNLLLLDEPLSALDALVRVSLRAEIRRIQSELGITSVYVTHDQEEALSISDRVAVMRNGTVEQIGAPEEIYRNPKTRFIASFIGTANQFNGQATSGHSVRCTLHTLRASVPERLVGSQVVILVRPENMRVFQAEKPVPEGDNVISGEVETITFMGSATRLTVNASGKRLFCDAPAHDQHFAHNQRVNLVFSPEACQVMED